MKRTLVMALFVTTLVTTGFSSEWANSEGSAFSKGNFNAAVGLSLLHLGFYGLVDYGVHDAISVGGGFGYNGYGYNSWWRYNYFPIVIRGSFHPFNLSVLADKVKIRNKLDPYAGLAMGWNIGWASWRLSGTEDDYNVSVGGFLIRENIGVRYYPTSNFFLTAEESCGFGLFNFGVGFKF